MPLARPQPARSKPAGSKLPGPLLALVAAGLLLAGCDETRPREPQRNPTPQPAPATGLPPANLSADDAVERAGPFGWDASAEAFTWRGQPLKAGRLWTFDGSTDGFVMSGGELLPAETAGLRVAERAVDAAIRSPSGLELDGARFSLVLVRLTRLRAAEIWDGSLHYSTAAHGEAAEFMDKPPAGSQPLVNETVVLAFDMAEPVMGGDDWTTSLIDQIRIDLDDSEGGEFLIHQIAVTEPPPAAPDAEPAAPDALRPKT